MTLIITWGTLSTLTHAQSQGRIQRVSLGGGDMANAGARAYSRDLGAEPPAGSKSRAPGQGEAESLLAFVRLRKTANLPSFSQIC